MLLHESFVSLELKSNNYVPLNKIFSCCNLLWFSLNNWARYMCNARIYEDKQTISPLNYTSFVTDNFCIRYELLPFLGQTTLPKYIYITGVWNMKQIVWKNSPSISIPLLLMPLKECANFLYKHFSFNLRFWNTINFRVWMKLPRH